jgi:hypothetical protein
VSLVQSKGPKLPSQKAESQCLCPLWIEDRICFIIFSWISLPLFVLPLPNLFSWFKAIHSSFSYLGSCVFLVEFWKCWDQRFAWDTKEGEREYLCVMLQQHKWSCSCEWVKLPAWSSFDWALLDTHTPTYVLIRTCQSLLDHAWQPHSFTMLSIWIQISGAKWLGELTDVLLVYLLRQEGRPWWIGAARGRREAAANVRWYWQSCFCEDYTLSDFN